MQWFVVAGGVVVFVGGFSLILCSHFVVFFPSHADNTVSVDNKWW